MNPALPTPKYMDSTPRLLDITEIFRPLGPGRPRRTQATIMFADLAGYSALMQADEGAAIAVRALYRATLTRAVAGGGGVIVQHYGDGSLTIFRRAADGAAAALEIQRTLAAAGGVPLRVGLHLAEVVRDDEGVYGHGVNVAARIQSLCPPGSVLASGTLVAALRADLPASLARRSEPTNRGPMTIRPMGTFQLRNMAHPHAIFGLHEEGIHMPELMSLRSTSAVMVAPPPPTHAGRGPGGLWSALVWEVRRRRVHRAVGGYSALVLMLALGAVCLASLTPVARHAPVWIGAGALMGLPVTLICSWFFDLAPDWVRITPRRGTATLSTTGG